MVCIGDYVKLIVLSDIHGNLTALEAVIQNSMKQYRELEGAVLLGDLIDYGMRSNQVVHTVAALPWKILANIWGNHENAIINSDYSRFSSERGVKSALYTKGSLNKETSDYIQIEMQTSGIREFWIGEKRCLAVHGSKADIFWKSINETENLEEYFEFDYVFSGHSHIPHFFEKYFPANNIQCRNQKKTIFINPGSVGQPRNLNCMAQYVVIDTDTEQVHFNKQAYDMKKEMALFTDEVDVFYRNRLMFGV